MNQRLFTPGPLTTDTRVRSAMLFDWGSRDAQFIALSNELRVRLLDVVNGRTGHVAIPIQGSGTFALEAMAATLVGPEHKLLVLVNGTYGRRLATIAQRLGRAVETIEWPEDVPVDTTRVADALAADRLITHVAVVHCETTTGILNPLNAIATVVARAGRVLLVDAMASFGALPIDLAVTPIAAVAASSNKCVEGVPGLGVVIVEKAILNESEGRSPSLSLDLADQQREFKTSGQWRFTPPVQVVAATVEALRLLEAEGGPPARLVRYKRNYERVREGLTALGYALYLDPTVQAPIIATFRPQPSRPFNFDVLYSRLARDGLMIYPGKLTAGEAFRVGCIGALTDADFEALIQAFASLD